MWTLSIKEFVKRGDSCHFAITHVLRPNPYKAHTHDFHEVFWIERGRGKHWFEGRPRPLRPGSLAIIHATDRHSFSNSSGKAGMRLVNIAFPIRRWENLRRRYFADRPDPFAGDIASREFQLSPEHRRRLNVVAEELYAGHRAARTIDRFLLNLFDMLQPPVEESTDLPAWLTGALQKINEPSLFQDGPRVLSRLTGKSPEHIARVVRRCVNQTPTDLINRSRMNFAARRLIGSAESIVNIALDCGFENLGHFYHVFSTVYGTTPARYRREQGQIVRADSRSTVQVSQG